MVLTNFCIIFCPNLIIYLGQKWILIHHNFGKHLGQKINTKWRFICKYFANKRLLWTYRDGKRVDSTFLHIREWLSCIRLGGNPSCGIQEGFEEAITAHMAGLSYKTGRKIEWDAETEQIISLPGEDLDAILLDNSISWGWNRIFKIGAAVKSTRGNGNLFISGCFFSSFL